MSNSKNPRAYSDGPHRREESVDSVSGKPDPPSDRISTDSFDKWYKERQYRQNILEGTHYFNGPGKITPPRRLSPSKLLQCHRKTVYKQRNAPEESGDPTGIYWFGTEFEEQIIVPFLQEAVVGQREYVANSLWVDYTVETDAGELRIKGATDPVIVTADAEPVLLTEIKTRRSIENTNAPSRRHKAQTHAYLKGLSEKYDRSISEAVILYGSRTTFDIKPFRIEFDPYFWRETVLNWAQNHAEYRLNDELPPAEPESSWECDYCSYSERCGKGQRQFDDIGPKGLLPGFTGYPREKLVEYLEAHDQAKLTPSLAHSHPDLADEYGALDWKCRGCGNSVAWDAIEWDGDTSKPPQCPECVNKGSTVLVDPAPEEQLGDEKDGW
ncbi:CRISPR-associated protein Cas4 [Halobellus marinus]|uniref:CRISPR-associated protein Cas4 n=1 Tax=Halobellus TaxID=1073986 RepID=UPI0028B24EDF|nr:PD-(D/E)XK nuclease family protein [Halobellus sp. DFY28]